MALAPAVQVRGLSMRYGDITALDGVSFDVPKGSCVAVLGPNGAGKSTLFAILATVRSATDGDIVVEGHSVRDDPAAVRHRIGVAFQDPIVSKYLRPMEVLLHHAALYAVPAGTAKARAVELLAFVGLDDRLEDKVKTFSGGMKRRLDLARVLMTEPDVLVLDEPTTGLDPAGRIDVQGRIRALAARGVTVLLSTHDMDEARRVADRVIMFHKGRIIADGTPAELAASVGTRVLRVEFDVGADDHVKADAKEALTPFGAVRDDDDAVEVTLLRDTPDRPGAMLDALDQWGVVYARCTVREPDLGDVFAARAGRPLANPDGEASA